MFSALSQTVGKLFHLCYNGKDKTCAAAGRCLCRLLTPAEEDKHDSSMRRKDFSYAQF